MHWLLLLRILGGPWTHSHRHTCSAVQDLSHCKIQEEKGRDKYDRRRENKRRGGKWLREKEVDKGVINNIWILHIISGNIVKELD